MKTRLILVLSLMFCAGVNLFAQTGAISDKKLNIFTLGDSNGSFPHSWPKQLQIALPNAQLINISKPGRTIGFVNLGDTTANSLMVLNDNLKKAADQTGDQPFDFIVLELGTNDGKAIFNDRQAEVPVNLETLITRIKSCAYKTISSAKIIIMSPPPYGSKAEATVKYNGGNERVKAMSAAFKQVAKRTRSLFINGYRTAGLDIETMTTDGLHLNETAWRKLIEPVVALMLKSSSK